MVTRSGASVQADEADQPVADGQVMPLDGNTPSTVAPEDIRAIVRGVAPIIREYVERQIAPLRDELSEQKKKNWQLQDGEHFGGQIADIVKTYIDRELAARDRKIEQLEKELDSGADTKAHIIESRPTAETTW